MLVLKLFSSVNIKKTEIIKYFELALMPKRKLDKQSCR